MASYPGSIFAVSTHNTGDTIQPADVNNCENEINAVETGLLNGFQHNLIPNADDTYNLGSSTNRFLKLWAQDADIDGTVTLGAALSVGSGGTGGTTLTAHGVLLGEGASAIAATSAGTSGQVLVSNGASSDPTWTTRLQLLDKSTTEQDVNTSTTETSVYSFSVPGNTLGTTGVIRLTLTGGYLNNSGGSSSLYVSVKYGGTIVAGGPNGTGAAYGGGGFSSSALRHQFVLQTILSANGATNSQRVVTWTNMYTGASPETDWNAQTNVNGNSNTTLAIDSTAAQTLTVTVQHSVNNAATSFKRYAVTTELLT